MRIQELETKKRELKNQYMSSLLSKKQTARELGGISVTTLDRMRREGLISSKKVRGSIMFRIEEVARFIIQG